MSTESNALSFRRAREADVPSIVALVESAYRGESSRRGWTTEADLLEGRRTDAADVLSILTHPDSRMLLAEKEGMIVGSLFVRREQGGVYVGMFAVSPPEQGKGVGRRLLSHAETVALSEFGVARVRMTVLAQRADIIEWYRRRGYLKTGETSPFPYDNLRFGIPKRQDLSFVILEKTLV